VSHYAFNWFSLPLIFTSVVSLGVGSVVLRREWASRVGRAFFVVTALITLWFGAQAVAYLAADPGTAKMWLRVAYVAVPAIPTSIYFYNIVALRLYRTHWPLACAMLLVSIAFVTLALTTDLLISRVHRFWWGYGILYGRLGVPFVAFFMIIILLGVTQYRMRLRDSPKGSSFRRRIVMSLIALTMISAASVDFLSKFHKEVYPFGHIAVLGYLLVIAVLENRDRVVYMTPAFAADQILATMHGAILVTDLNGTVEMCNQAAAALLGRSQAELIDRSLVSILPQNNGNMSLLEECVTLGSLRDRETCWRTTDGRARDISVSASLITEPDDEPVAMVIAALDITDRKQTEVELRSYAGRLESIHDLDRRILSAQSPGPTAEVALKHLRSLISLTWGRVALFDADGEICSILAVFGEDAATGKPPIDAFEPYMCLPLLAEERLMGALELAANRSCPFGRRESEIALEVSNALTIALQESVHRETLQKAEASYRTLFDGVPVGLYRSTPEGLFLDVNNAAVSMMGYPDRETLLKVGALELFASQDDPARFQELVDQHGVVRDFEAQVVRLDGSLLWAQIDSRAVWDPSGRLVAHEGSLIDITERKAAESRLVHEALHDGLTDLPNRAFLIERLGHSIDFAKRRDDYRFAVLFLDFDRFKVVNDSLGHTAGDQLLVAAARRLQTCVRQVDAVARLGGDEFAVLLDDIRDLEDAIVVAERTLSSLTQPFLVQGQEVFVSASIGIAVGETGYDRPDDVLRDADIAMYRAKALGKARYEVFDTTMHLRVVESLQLETDLRRALSRGEFRLHYQPIVSLETGRIASFEALIRWQHPQRGLLLPKDFLDAAEETGLIVPIGRWVTREACRQMHAWHQEIPSASSVGVSVNLSEKQFYQADLVEQLSIALRDSGLDPVTLHLEITETVVMEDAVRTRDILARLRHLGVRLQIDDFGTGFSSMSVLHRFALDTLKMDHSFVSGEDGGGRSAEVVEAIVSIAHALHMEVVAEGVEKESQMTALRPLGCEYAQGDLFSRPMPADTARELLLDTPSWAAVRSGQSTLTRPAC